MWIEALNQAGVKASSALRRVESIYYPSAIRESVPYSLRIDTTSEVAVAGTDGTAKVPTSSNTTSEVAEQPEGTKNEKNANQGVAPDAMKPPIVTQDPPAEKEAPKTMEIVLASLPLPTNADPASKGLEVSEVTSTQHVKAPPKEKLVIKKK